MDEKIEGYGNNILFNSNVHPSVDKVKLASASEAELRTLASGSFKKCECDSVELHPTYNQCLDCGKKYPLPAEKMLGGTASKKADMPGIVPEGSPAGYTEYFAFLDELRASGATNMFGAAPYLMDEFGLEKAEARKILSSWMQNFATDLEPEVDDKTASTGPVAEEKPGFQEHESACRQCKGANRRDELCPKGRTMIDRGPKQSLAARKLAAKEPLFKSRLVWALVDLHGAFGGDWNMIRKMLHVRYPKHKKEIDNFLGAVSRNVESIHVLAKMAAAKGCDICEGHGTVPADSTTRPPLYQGSNEASCPECGGSGNMSKPKQAGAADACPSRDSSPGAPHSYEKGKCVYCSESQGGVKGCPAGGECARRSDGMCTKCYRKTAGVTELWGDATKYLSDLAKSLLGTADAYEEMADAVDAYEKLDASADEAIEADDRMMEKGSAWQAGVEGKCPGCNHSLKKLSDGSYLCHDDDCECVCGSHLDKEAAKTAAGELSLEQASQILARFAKAESMRKTRLAELEAEIEEKYKLVEAAPLKADAIKKVTEGMAALKTQQRRFEGVIFRLTDVLHRKSFRPTEFMKMVKALFEGQTEMQLKINELEQAATKPQSTTTELEVVVPEGAMEEPVAPEPAPAAKPAKEPASKAQMDAQETDETPEPAKPKAKAKPKAEAK